MHRIYLCCFILLLATVAGNGQSHTRRVLKEDTGKIYLRGNPLGILDPLDGNLTLGGEYRFNDTWAVTLDAGAIFYSLYFINAKKTTGILLRPAIRVYPNRWKDFFIDLQLNYKDVNYWVKDWVQKDVVANVASYEEHKIFRYKKKVMGGQIVLGFRDYFTRNNRFYFEGYMGVGVRYKDEGVYKEPTSRYNRGIRINRTMNGTSWVPSVPVGIRFVYLIK